jgi:tetratricopeptide (TPR) repeat protein
MALFCSAAPGEEIVGYPASVEAYDSREVALLPRFCSHTMFFRDSVPGGSNPGEVLRWRSVMGPTFEAMHHYCWGLMKTNRANLLAKSATLRKFYLGDAISEYDFVIRRAPEDFILLPEILTKKGENFARLGKGPLAVLQFERAAELKPDYWPPYAQLSDYYKEAADFGKAREVLEKGLSFAPDASALKRRLMELGAAGNKARNGGPSGADAQAPAAAR